MAHPSLAPLADCTVCPRACRVDRHAGVGVCEVGWLAGVLGASADRDEVSALRGSRGSGSVVFGGSNLPAAVGQDTEIPGCEVGQEQSGRQLADLFLRLQDQGCHNLNLVNPSHVVPQLVEALDLVRGQLRVPVVYSSCAYDTVRTLRWLEGYVDVYLPDFKFWTARTALRMARAGNYPQVARAALGEMHRQVGDLQLDEGGLAIRGLLLRHRVSPDLVDESVAILRWVAERISVHTGVDVTSRACPRVEGPSTSANELAVALEAAREAGLYRFVDGRG